jgi:hypothetical protein
MGECATLEEKPALMANGEKMPVQEGLAYFHILYFPMPFERLLGGSSDYEETLFPPTL